MTRELLREPGWSATKRGAHVRLHHVTGLSLTVPSTPSDHRAQLNFAADVRRARKRIALAEAAYASRPALARQGGWVLSIYVMLPVCVAAAFVATYFGLSVFYAVIMPGVQ